MGNLTLYSVEDQQQAIIPSLTETLSKGYSLGDIFGYSDLNYEALYALGHNFYQQAHYADALKVFAFLVMLDPTERRFLLAQASCLQMLDRFSEAVNVYSMASFLDLNDPRPYFQAAECLLALRRKPSAIQSLKLAIKHCKSKDHEATKAQANALLELINI